MNSMFPVWTLSCLILSYTLGSPIFNNQSRGSYMETFPNVTVRNFTDFINQTSRGSYMETFPNAKDFMGNRSNFVTSMRLFGCALPTCAVYRLDEMKSGDEEAGAITGDPWGPGKK